MDYSTAAECWEQIEDSKLAELRLALVRAAIHYSAQRVQWRLVRPENRIAMSPARTAAHNTFIDACNILSRNMLKSGEANNWRNTLGTDRKDIGDFACYVVLFLGLAAR